MEAMNNLIPSDISRSRVCFLTGIARSMVLFKVTHALQ